MQLSTLKEKMALRGITGYQIFKALDEPKSSIYKFLKGEKVYTEEKEKEIFERINDMLDYDPADKMIEQSPEDPDLFIRLYALGLDSKSFTPDEKYKLAVAYKKLTDLKNKP